MDYEHFNLSHWCIYIMAFNKLHIHMKSCRMLLYVWTQIIVLRTCIVHRYWANEITLPFSFVKQWNRCIQRLLAMYCYCSCCHGWNRVFHWSISWSGICEFLMFAFAFCFEKTVSLLLYIRLVDIHSSVFYMFSITYIPCSYLPTAVLW